MSTSAQLFVLTVQELLLFMDVRGRSRNKLQVSSEHQGCSHVQLSPVGDKTTSWHVKKTRRCQIRACTDCRPVMLMQLIWLWSYIKNISVWVRLNMSMDFFFLFANLVKYHVMPPVCIDVRIFVCSGWVDVGQIQNLRKQLNHIQIEMYEKYFNHSVFKVNMERKEECLFIFYTIIFQYFFLLILSWSSDKKNQTLKAAARSRVVSCTTALLQKVRWHFGVGRRDVLSGLYQSSQQIN